MLQLTLGVLLRTALTEVGILSGHSLAGLGALHNHASLVFRKGQHDGQNQISRQRVLYKSHVQDVYPNTPVKSSLTEETPSIAVRAKRSSLVTTKVSPSCNF